MQNSNVQRFHTRQHMVSHTFEIYHYCDAYPNEVALHHHDFYEIYYFMNGSVNYIIEGRTYNLTPGDLLLISPSELHQPLFLTEKTVYERIVLWINKQFLEQFAGDEVSLTRCFDVSDPNHTNLLRLNAAQRQRMSGLLEKLLEENAASAYGRELMMNGLLIEFLVEMNRLHINGPAEVEPANRSVPLIDKVLDYINVHYSEPLTVESLAAHFFVSKYYLLHEFKQHVGTSVYHYIIQRRLIIARQMLAGGTAPSSVYQKCGFGDYANFYRAFKAAYHMSPKEYMDGSRDEE